MAIIDAPNRARQLIVELGEGNGGGTPGAGDGATNRPESSVDTCLDTDQSTNERFVNLVPPLQPGGPSRHAARSRITTGIWRVVRFS